jgi:hypothetical protein
VEREGGYNGETIKSRLELFTKQGEEEKRK